MAADEVSDVLVVGGGPTGLALACGLRLQGVGVRVVDRMPEPATTSRANFVHVRGSEVLDRLGALGELPEQAVRAMRITTYLGDKPLMRLRFGDPGLRTAAHPWWCRRPSSSPSCAAASRSWASCPSGEPGSPA